jgi:hypothetical protein
LRHAPSAWLFRPCKEALVLWAIMLVTLAVAFAFVKVRRNRRTKQVSAS